MEIILSSISAGGLTGIADQYLCLLVVGLSARFNFVQLAGPMQFMSEWWFIVLVALLWLLTLAPAYSSLLAPGIMNAINTAVRFVSGFVVPISSAMLALAYAGIIINLDPELERMLETIRIFNGQGGLDTGGLVIAGGSAVIASAMTGMKALAKPAVSVSTQTAGHLSAPIYATIENVLALVITVAIYTISKIDPWLLVVLLAVAFVIVAGILGFAIYQMWRLKRGIGRVLYLAQVNPRAGLSITVEFLVWGIGWFAWGKWARGVIMLAIWLIMVSAFVALQISIPVIFAFAAPVIPIILVMGSATIISVALVISFSTASALLKMLEDEVANQPGPASALPEAA